MKRQLSVLFLTALLLVSALPGRAQQTILEGSTPGGAFYAIVVPDSWNGDLVFWNHGFNLDPVAPPRNLGPLGSLWLQEGYAVAVSSYRQSGWAVFKTNKDLKALLEVFKAEFGNPSEIILTGASLGGIVSAFALEKGRLGNVTGMLTICGAMAGSRNWDGAIDLRLAYDVVCADIPEAAIPGGAEGLPKGVELSNEELEEAVNACTGVGLKKKKRSREQKQNLARLLELARIPEDFLMLDMEFVTVGLGDLIHDKGKLKGKQGVGNADVEYDDPEIDALIERVDAHKRGAKKLRKFFLPKGKVGDAKIISIHTDKDGLVVVENQSAYAEVVPPEQLTVGIVVEKSPSHCAFSPAEVVGAWETLRAWIAGAPQPTVEDLQGLCQGFEPLLGGPCRYDPDFVVPDMDSRIRPRQPEASGESGDSDDSDGSG